MKTERVRHTFTRDMMLGLPRERRKNLFGGGQQAAPTPPPAPVIAPPAPIPDSQSPAVIEAAKKAQTDALARAGRSSTILTAPTNRGSDYSGRTLG